MPIFKTYKLPGEAICLFLVKTKPVPNLERDRMEGAESTSSALPQGSPSSESEFPFSEIEGKFTIPSMSILKGKSDIDTQKLNYEALLGFRSP